jgi:hypothetical protein
MILLLTDIILMIINITTPLLLLLPAPCPYLSVASG